MHRVVLREMTNTIEELCALCSALLSTQKLNNNKSWEWKQGYNITNRLWSYSPQLSISLNTETFPKMWRNLSGKDIEFLLLACWLQIGGFVSSILSQEDTAIGIFFLHDISELHSSLEA